MRAPYEGSRPRVLQRLLSNVEHEAFYYKTNGPTIKQTRGGKDARGFPVTWDVVSPDHEIRAARLFNARIHRLRRLLGLEKP